MAKKPKLDPESVAAETPEPEAVVVEPVADEPLGVEPLTSDDRGEPADAAEPKPDETLLAPEFKPAKVWKPGSCINCGETTTDTVPVIAVERFRCTRCGHTWTLVEEQAPFRRLARR